MKYQLENIAAIVGGRFHPGDAPTGFSHLLLDSRKLIYPSDSVFFALKARRDGHSYIDELYAKGLRNFVVSQESGFNAPDANLLIVDDTLSALQSLAAYHRGLFTYPVIGITGSNGKTIIKEWLNQLLGDRYKIVRSPRSYNSQTGVPLSTWQMEASHDLGIFEAGISHPGEMEKLEKIIRPNIGVYANIGPAHDEGFDSIGLKAAEKAKLFRHSELIIYCSDHQFVVDAIKAMDHVHNAKFMTWGRSENSTLRVLDIDYESSATVIHAAFATENISIRIPFTDNASIDNAIHCWCVLLALKMNHHEIQRRVLQLVPVAMRLELKQGLNYCSIINDAYNADLASLSIALDFLLQQKQHKKKTVILSDFLESGKPDSELYPEIASQLSLRSVDRLIGIGESIRLYENAFFDAGIKEVDFYPSVDAFRTAFAHIHFANETILLKGARKFELEALESILEEKVHQTVMEINLDSLIHNLHQYQSILKPSTKLMAMVKAFSYGSGSYEIANVLQFHKVDYLAVAYTDEGIDLRKGGIQMPIMVMNADSSSFNALVEYDLEPVIYSLGMLQRFMHFLDQEAIRDFPVHIELETGMHRLGFAATETDEMISLLSKRSVFVKSVFTHLAASEDAAQDNFTDQQASLFLSLRDKIVRGIGYPVIAHMANTSGISRHTELQLDMVRLGIGLYGIDYSGRLNLLEVSTLK
ncbi:MAG TPA: bifunctional UDP-N-acetylmuramoyl-tripeptide:D-alanyl-D-alanine ligase/alanine racemase, partial [Flavitalea sp.]|nr:bifunctional UDP-N-acetylmuramoyl-tripeptide:D-alanyl-D-alanine ligase/alanine racemase [Flavitalea sp.]